MEELLVTLVTYGSTPGMEVLGLKLTIYLQQDGKDLEQEVLVLE